MTKIERQLRILEALEQNPETTQANLAAQLGVAVGSVNWYLKRLIRKGYVKATRLQRRRMKYLVTPQGLAHKAQLASKYMKTSLRVYRQLRQAARETIAQVRQAGYPALVADGTDETMEIFRLTCLEEGVEIKKKASPALPVVYVEGTGFGVKWPNGEGPCEGVKRKA